MSASRISLTSILALPLLAVALPASADGDVRWHGGTVYDFGHIAESGGAVSHRFVLRNTGVDTLDIVRAKGRCGCTTAVHTSRGIVPGDTASVTVRFDPSGRDGDFKQRVIVRFTGETRYNYLFVKGHVDVSAPPGTSDTGGRHASSSKDKATKAGR